MKLTQEIVRELLDYDSETGIMIWKTRKVEWYRGGVKKYSAERAASIWNKRFSGKIAGSISPDGYRQICLLSKTYKIHRVIWFWMTGEWPEYIDHVNGVRDDNRWDNLKNVCMRENNVNMKLRSANTSGYKGVYWNKQNQKWMARIGIFVDGKSKSKYLGFFDNPEEAHEIYAKEAKRLGYTERHIYGK